MDGLTDFGDYSVSASALVNPPAQVILVHICGMCSI